MAMGGIETEQDYPYHQHKEGCHFNSGRTRTKVQKVYKIPANEDAIKQMVYQYGPVSICEFLSGPGSGFQDNLFLF